MLSEQFAGGTLRHVWALVVLTPLLAIGCVQPVSRPASDDAPGSSEAPVDAAIPEAVAGQEGWNYQRAASADFDGDGREERLVVTARVAMRDGEPLWEDGQTWQAYVEEPDGQRTYLFARFVQLGTVEGLVTRPSEADGTPLILLTEQTPHFLRIYEIRYLGPANVHTETRINTAIAHYLLEPDD